MDSKTAGLREALQPLFGPAHVAVIGASSTPGKQGNTAIRYLKRCGFPGRISPVNPAGGEIEGLTCYRSIKEVRGQVDCVLLVIPAAAVVTAIRECAEVGVRVAIVGANGFAELGTAEGRARQAELAAVARASGMRIVGAQHQRHPQRQPPVVARLQHLARRSDFCRPSLDRRP